MFSVKDINTQTSLCIPTVKSPLGYSTQLLWAQHSLRVLAVAPQAPRLLQRSLAPFAVLQALYNLPPGMSSAEHPTPALKDVQPYFSLAQPSSRALGLRKVFKYTSNFHAEGIWILVFVSEHLITGKYQISAGCMVKSSR